jgi:tetratricopeptide (TPR) repeat protein
MVDYGMMIAINKGDFAGALALHREALEDFRQRYGENHFMISPIQILIAGDYFRLGDYAQEEAYAQESFKSAQSSGFSDLQELPARSALARSLINRGDYQAAQTAIEQMLSEARGKGEEPRYVVVAEELQAWAAYHQGNYAKAKAHAEKFLSAANSFARTPGNDSYRYDSIYSLARSLNKLKEARRAETLIREAIESLKKSPVAENLFLAARLDSVLGESLTAERRFAEAETLLLKAYEIQKAHVLPQEFQLVETRRCLAELYRAWGKSDEAKQYE